LIDLIAVVLNELIDFSGRWLRNLPGYRQVVQLLWTDSSFGGFALQQQRVDLKCQDLPASFGDSLFKSFYFLAHFGINIGCRNALPIDSG
jgi:hypothetical protein